MKEQAAVFTVLLAAMLWGTTGTAQTFAPQSAHPIAVGAMRLSIGGIALFLIVLLQGKIRDIKSWPIAITLTAAASIATYQPLFFSAVATTGVAVGTVVGIGSAPVLTGLLEWFFLKKRPERSWGFATLLAIVGCLFLFSNQEELTISPTGIVMALGAGLSFAVYTLVSKQLLEQHASDVVTAIVFSLAAVLLLPLLFFYPLHWFLQPAGFAVALHLGLFATALAYLLFSKGLTGIPAANAVTLALAEPLTATILGVVVVGEMLTPSAWVGVTLLFIGLGILSVRRKNRKLEERVDFFQAE